MLNSQILQGISNKIREIMDSSPAGDVERNLHALLQSVFTKLELVTREEFDIQVEVLQRTRQKLEQMESRVAELEAMLDKDRNTE